MVGFHSTYVSLNSTQYPSQFCITSTADGILSTVLRGPPIFVREAFFWHILARDFVIWIFSVRESVIKESFVQRDLLKMRSLFRERVFKCVIP